MSHCCLVNNLSLEASVFDIRFDLGAPLSFVAYYTPNNLVFDLTGYNAQLRVKPSPYSKEYLPGWDLTTANGGLTIVTGDTVTPDLVTVVGAMGVQAVVPASVTEGINWRKAFYRLDLLDTGGGLLPFMKGLLTPAWG